MKFLDELRGEAAILQLAETKAVSREEIESAIQQAIDAAWNSHDRDSRELRCKIFRGVKPTPALFVGRLARYAKQ